jgi:4'-phosphopantetheinyl transferase EntD
LAKIICHPSELESLPSFAISKTSLLNLYFSARESVFKAVYAYNAHRLNYQDIRIELDLRQQKFYIHFDKLAFPIPLAGRFVFSEHHVATLVFRNHWASERNPS